MPNNFISNVTAKISRLLRSNKVLSKTPTRDYLRDWVNEEGKEYRINVYQRQGKGGQKPLISNPTFQEVKQALRPHSPNSVLEVGCGWGRLLDELKDEFNVEGCDISDDMLGLCPPGLKVFKLDIVKVDENFLQKNMNHWDVILTRGVMLYFMNSPQQMAKALENLSRLANKKVLFWEWLEVCEHMKKVFSHSKFEFHPIEKRDE